MFAYVYMFITIPVKFAKSRGPMTGVESSGSGRQHAARSTYVYVTIQHSITQHNAICNKIAPPPNKTLCINNFLCGPLPCLNIHVNHTEKTMGEKPRREIVFCGATFHCARLSSPQPAVRRSPHGAAPRRAPVPRLPRVRHPLPPAPPFAGGLWGQSVCR